MKYILLLQFFLWISILSLSAQPDTSTPSLSVSVKTVMPASFKGTKPNVIIDSANCLSPLFEKLLMLRNPDNTEKPVVRIVHIGDSHVRSHEFTPALNFPLTENFGNAAIGLIAGYRSEGILEESGSPGVICQCIGINGATSQNFMDDVYLSQIQRLQPDLIIISLGTNESIGNYSSSSHYDAMENLYSALKNYCPAAAVLYTTPPGAFRIRYGKYRRHRRVYTKIISIDENWNIRKVAATITRFAADHGAACWDLFNIAGGNEYACQNWLTGNYFQRDRLHFVSDGYALQGNLLYEALMNGYNEYVNKHE